MRTYVGVAELRRCGSAGGWRRHYFDSACYESSDGKAHLLVHARETSNAVAPSWE